MGLIYSRHDSEKLIQALSKNLTSSKEVTSQLKVGSQKIIQAVDGRIFRERLILREKVCSRILFYL